MPRNPDKDIVAAYVARKTAKGTYGEKKAHKWKRRNIYTGQCPCVECGHHGDPMITCDADWNDCKCCDEVCS